MMKMKKYEIFKYESISVLSQLFSDFLDFFLVKSFSDGVGLLDSSFVPFRGSFSSFAFQLFDQVFSLPSDLAGKVS